MVLQKQSSFFKSIRFKILLGGFLVAIGLFFIVLNANEAQETTIIRLQQYYALTAFGLLYLTLLISPLTVAFPTFPQAGLLKKSRRAFGQLVFFYSLLHGGIAFFGQLGGFNGVQFWDSTYQIAISLSFTALCIFFLLALTSFDTAVAKLGYKNWKNLHRLIYVAGVFLLIHAWLLGSHFADRFGIFMTFLSVALSFLFSLEAFRFDQFLREKNWYMGRMPIFFTVVTGLFLAYFIWLTAMNFTQSSFYIGI